MVLQRPPSNLAFTLSEPLRFPGLPFRVSNDGLSKLSSAHPAGPLSTLVSVAGGVRAKALALEVTALDGAEDDLFPAKSRFEREPVSRKAGTDFSIVVHPADDREARRIVGYATLRTLFLSELELDASIGEDTARSRPSHYFLGLHVDAVVVGRQYRGRSYGHALCAGLVEVARQELSSLDRLFVGEGRRITADIDLYYEPSGEAGERLMHALERGLEELARAFNDRRSGVEPFGLTLRGMNVDRGW